MKINYLQVKLSCIIFFLLVFCLGQAFSQECGDVNSSGSVDIVDALLIAQYYVGLNPANFDPTVADVDANGSVNIVDALLISQLYVGLISALPGCSQIPEPTPTLTPGITNPPGTDDCSNAPHWSSTTVYEKQGTIVYYNGNLYESNHYSVGLNPEENSGPNSTWILIGACDPNTTPGPTMSPRPEPTQGSGTLGYATRFWDCCKPHCSWPQNVPSGMEPLKTCLQDGYNENPDPMAYSSCEEGDAYVCYKFIPYAINEDLAYGFAATASGDICGKCYELQFTGEGHYDNTPGAVALQGKRMIVMAINIGFDVGGGQFDIMVPGGGVGAFNGCSNQWGIPTSELGVTFGGLLSTCNQEYGNYDHQAIKDCLRVKNDELFRSRELIEMAEALDWFIDWYEAADNPNLYYWEVPCPQELIDTSGLQRP